MFANILQGNTSFVKTEKTSTYCVRSKCVPASTGIKIAIVFNFEQILLSFHGAKNFKNFALLKSTTKIKHFFPFQCNKRYVEIEV